MSDTPFLDISGPLQRMARTVPIPAPEPEEQRQAATPLATPGATHDSSPPLSGKPLAGAPLSRAEMVFEAALKAVRKTLTHLSEEAIRFPPKTMPDATLAAQIALHVVMARTALSRPHLRAEFRRSTSVLGRAQAVVSGRLEDETFAAAYRQIAADTETFLAAMEDGNV